MEVIHLLFVEKNKQQSNAWCDSYRSILNHFDTAILVAGKDLITYPFIIMGLKSLIQKRQYPPVLCSPFTVLCSLFSAHCLLLSVICYLFTVPPVNSLKHDFLHERASPRY